MCCRFELLGTLILFIQALTDRRAQKRAARVEEKVAKRHRSNKADNLQCR
jgi:hypothetical protein